MSARLAAACVVFAVAGCATTTGDAPAQAQAALETIDSFLGDPQMTWLRENLPRARAIIVAPRVKRAAFGIGGSAGEAVVLARRATNGEWSGPAFYTVTEASVGFQAGADVSEVLVLVMTDRGLNALLAPSVKLGGEASISAGPMSGGIVPASTDMVALARSRGLYAGVTLAGAALRPDEEANRAFYGKPASPGDILGGSIENPAGAPLRRLLAERSR